MYMNDWLKLLKKNCKTEKVYMFQLKRFICFSLQTFPRHKILKSNISSNI